MERSPIHLLPRHAGGAERQESSRVAERFDSTLAVNDVIRKGRKGRKLDILKTETVAFRSTDSETD